MDMTVKWEFENSEDSSAQTVWKEKRVPMYGAVEKVLEQCAASWKRGVKFPFSGATLKRNG